MWCDVYIDGLVQDCSNSIANPPPPPPPPPPQLNLLTYKSLYNRDGHDEDCAEHIAHGKGHQEEVEHVS